MASYYPYCGMLYRMDGQEQMVGLSQAIHQRNYQRARARALVRLSRIFKDEYKQFLEEERVLDESLGKKWIGIDTNTGNPLTIQSYKDAVESSLNPDNEGENEGYYGGEEE